MSRILLFGYLLLSPLVFFRQTIEAFEFVKFTLLLLASLLFLGLGAIALPRLSRAGFYREIHSPLVCAMLAFALSAVLSTIFSSSRNASFFGAHDQFAGLLTVFANLVLFFAARSLLRTIEHVRTLMLAVVLATAGVTGYGLFQTAGCDPFEWANCSTIGSEKRPFATLGHPNLLGAYLVLAAPLVAWRAAIAKGKGRFFIGLLCITVCALVVLTLSRAAWLGLILSGSMALVGVAARRGRITRSMIGIAAVLGVSLLAVVVALPVVHERLNSFLDTSGRLAIWPAAMNMALDRPLLGWGLDTFPQVFGRYGGVAYWYANHGDTPGRAHNEFLNVLATQGLVGGIAFCGVAAALGWSLGRAWKFRPNERGWIVTIGAALGGFAVTEMFGFAGISSGSLVVILIALSSRLAEPVVMRTPPRISRVFPVGWRLVQVGLVAVCVGLIHELVIDPWQARSASQLAESHASHECLKARNLHDAAVEHCPREPQLWNRLALHAEGMASQVDSDFEEKAWLARARMGYAQALSLHPADAFFHAGIGRTSGALARLNGTTAADAYEAFEKAQRLDPGNAYHYVDAARTALRLADAERALQYTEAGLALYPDFGPLREQVALRYLLLNRVEDADRAFQFAIQGRWLRYIDCERVVAMHQEFARRLAIMRQSPAHSPVVR